MERYFRLFEALKKIYGSKFVSDLFGKKRTNIIKLPPKEAKDFLKKELNITEAGDRAVAQGKKNLAELVLDVKQIEKLNDQELLTLTNNAERMAQRTNPEAPVNKVPSSGRVGDVIDMNKPAPRAPADIIDMKTQEKVPPEGIASLLETSGQKAPPGTLMGNLESRIKQLEASGEDLSKMKGQYLKDIMEDPSMTAPDASKYRVRKGMSDLYKQGLVKATASDIMIADMKSGKFPATKEMQQEILEGSPKSLDYFRRFYGEDALEVLDSLIPDLENMRTSREAADFAKKQYNFEPKMDRAPGSIDLDDAKKAEDEFGINSLKDDIDDPEEFAVGGRVGYAYGSGLKLIKLLNKEKKSLKQAIKESADDIIPTGDSKLDADMAVDNMLEKLGVDRDAVDGYDILDAYGEAYKTVTGSMLKTRKNASVFSEQYLKKIDDEIIDEGLYTRKEWEKTPETIKNKIRGQMDPDWKEANFGEDYDFDQVRGKELEGEDIDISNPETLDDFTNFAKKNDPEGYKKIEDMVNDSNQQRKGIGGLKIDMNDVMDEIRLMKEKGLKAGKPGDYDKFLEMKISGELGPEKQMKTIKMELFNKYSRYLDEETMDVIQASDDPQKVAEAYANVREAALLSDRGVPTEEIVDTIIKAPRTKQADGTGPQGLANLLGL